jgi:hypothetical protein
MEKLVNGSPHLTSDDPSVVITYTKSYTSNGYKYDCYEVNVDTTKAILLTRYQTDVCVKFKIGNKYRIYNIANFGLGKALDVKNQMDQARQYIEYLRRN